MCIKHAQNMNNLALTNSDDMQPNYLGQLNPAQRQAVEALDGPVLVLAGAGTGKTRVLTTRLAHLLLTGKAMPGQILAVTFTNKAAAEIKERVGHILGRSVEGWFLGTFHALAARLLRPHAEKVGLRPNFTILSTDDQLRLCKQLIEAENLDEKKTPARVVLSLIERWKDRGLTPLDVQHEISDYAEGKLPKIYADYQKRLSELNAADFGDLLLHQLTLLRCYPDVLAEFQNRFRYVLVDEYQDTNVAQYLWLRLLAQGHRNLCVVGDEDQSIYGWRGAEIGNILRFEEDFPGATVIRLEENYRSTAHILGAATQLIAKNQMRLGKTLWTKAETGEKLSVRGFWDGEEEARWVADEIENLQRRQISLKDMAIMVRAGFQTRQFEERFIQLGIPYRVLVGARFYERAEIRDALAYLRLTQSPQDDLAFERIINLPKRGIGPAAIQQLYAYSRTANTSLAEAALRLSETDELKPKLRSTLFSLMQDFARWRQLLNTLPPAEVAQIVLDESGYTGMWQADKSPEAPGRLDNLKEFVSAIAEFDTLESFLEHVSLVLEVTEQKDVDQISLMTLHGAKGLEFAYVFLPGWEEEIFPSRLSLSENGAKGLEEERRLAYVGITRARKKATISYVANRLMHGSWMNAIPSRFIAELPPENVELFSTIQSAMRNGGNFGFGAAYGSSQNTGQTGRADLLPQNSFHSQTTLRHQTNQSRNDGYSDYENKRKAPPLWQQLNAGKSRSAFPQTQRAKTSPSISIEGSAVEVFQKYNENGFNPGDRVSHERFGYGTVTRVENDKLEINFDKTTPKKIMASFVTKIR